MVLNRISCKITQILHLSSCWISLKFTHQSPQCWTLVVDDLILDINKEVASAIILGSHHRKISLFFISQNLFPNCNTFRLMSANSHYYVLFRNQQNFRQVHTLARQIFVEKYLNRILAAYKRASENPREFILLSFSPLLPKELTVLTYFWRPWPSIYL